MLIELLENPKALEIFEKEPVLDEIFLSKLVFDADGPTITITMQIPEAPIRPPGRWLRRKYNAVSIELQALGIVGIDLSGWSTNNVVRVSLIKTNDGTIRVAATGSGTNFEFRCEWLRISGITPYLRA